MKKLQSILSFLIIAIIGSFILYSCEDDDICTDEGQVPRLVADMYYSGTDIKLEDSIYYWAYILNGTDTVQIDNGFVSEKSSFGMGVTKNDTKKVFYTVAQGPDVINKDENDVTIDTTFAKRDRLILEYESLGNAYTSKACGFGLTFHGVKVSLVSGKTNGEGNWIKSIETVNTEIKDGSTPIIKLFTNARN
ncbi:DUF6452 family protein [Chishuiella sp.]|uniref:DUF6452 family protein n=1 Tax=Chishuiella sp. TaxID=1969467 RepID=UPI0028AE5AC5|nr:DUF6452 family protein [Chishuiella sp.]